MSIEKEPSKEIDIDKVIDLAKIAFFNHSDENRFKF